VRRTTIGTVCSAVALAAVAGCGVVPHNRSADAPVKRAATAAQAAPIVTRYAVVRAESAKTADVGHLADVESESLLEIDSTLYYAARALGTTPGAAAVSGVKQVWSGAFTQYPLWFATVVDSPGEQTQVALVFARKTSTDPWRAVMGPRLAADTALPEVLTDDGAAAMLGGDDSDDSDGLSASPTTVARRYADVLQDARSRFADQFEQDSFIVQMRQLAQAQPREHIAFRQTWHADPVSYAFRLADGGALIFADLRRVDSYRIEGKHELGFAGSEASVFLPEPVHRFARLVYEHEVLLLAPAGRKPLAIGQFGGLVSATGR
jgi:hypothetical protein